MMKCNLLSKEGQIALQKIISKNLIDIKVYTLAYRAGLNICGFIKMIFKNDVLVITTGDLADDILILNEDGFVKEKQKYDLQEDVEIKESFLNNISGLEDIKQKKVIDVNCIQKPDEEYYWKIEFLFEKRSLIINALIDELAISITK